MVFRGANAAAEGGAEDHRTRQAAPCPVAKARGVVHDLVDGRIDETHKLDLGHWPQPLGRHADGDAGDRQFGEGRVNYPIGPEAGQQALGGAEHPAIDADVFAERHNAGILFHCSGEGQFDGAD